jgi:eukaryotic-like serine/threonine-protein kinase
MMLHPGDVIDRYRLEAPLGVGAFGEVWKASQLAHGEAIGVTCAIKVLRLSSDRFLSSPRTFANGWLDEVRNLVRVAGDTIPRIIEADIWNEHAYIAMELLDGVTLRARLADGPIPWRRALFIADQIARAIEAAHDLGVIHRDLKPQNVVLAGPRRVCVVDWGIARLCTATAPGVVDAAPCPAGENDSTDAGPAAPLVPLRLQGVVGTTGYVAPEVYDGAPPAPEQDVYALGVVLYEMIAGCLPHAVPAIHRNAASFDSMRAFRVSVQRATVDYALVSLRERKPDTPRAVVELVDALLARDPAQRPRDLRRAIARVSRFPDGVPDPPYPGLSTLGARHAGLYFGQQEAILHVLERLESQRAALLWGPSGSGKSSLALAGVAATMDRTLFLDVDGWDIHVVRPRDAQRFRVAPGAPATGRSRIGHVVIVDQLEEIVDLEATERDALCAAVLALLDGSAPVRFHDTVIGAGDPVRMIATIRDDLEWRVDREVPALRPLLDRRIIVTGVDANCARQIIEEPAQAFGYDVEDIAAVSREVEVRLMMERAKLPMVQFALSEWWERRDRHRKLLPAAAWGEIGGVDGALSSVAETFYLALDEEAQERVKALFVQLLQGGRKQPVVESMLDPESRILVEQLIRLRLIGRRDKEGREPFYEAEHEYLSETWTRLARWLAEARTDRALIDELERDAAAYAHNYDRDRLWRKRRLAAAVEMTESGQVVFTPGAQRFLQHAQRHERRGRRAFRAVLAVVVLVGAAAVWELNESRSRIARDLLAAEDRLAHADAMVERAKREVGIATREVAEANQEAAHANQAGDDANQRLRATRQKLADADRQRAIAERRQRTAEEQAKRAEAIAAQQEREMNEALIVEQRKVQEAEAEAEKWQTKAAEFEQRAAAAEARKQAAEQREQQSEARTIAARDAERVAERRAAEADARTKRAEVRAKQAKYFEEQALQKALVYEAQVRGFQTRLQYSCVR